jgi:uncharacterized protein YndB with AHSA1/START domain
MTTKAIAGTFVVEREIRIRAPRERVFELLASREGLALWVPVSLLEPRVGGNIEFRFAPEPGVEKTTFGEVTAYDPPSRIAFTWDFKDDPLDARTEVAINLTSEGAATLVRLTHTGFVDEEECSKHDEGWGYWLARLEARGEGKVPAPDSSIEALLHSQAIAASHEQAKAVE